METADEIIVDSFAGGGGASLGICQAVGRGDRDARREPPGHHALPMGTIMAKATRKKLTEQEKLARRLQRSADRKNAKTQAEIPLFADQLEPATFESEKRAWQFNKAYHAGERCSELEGNRGLASLACNVFRRLAAQHLGARFAEVDQYIRATYPSSYWGMTWKEVLASQRKFVLRWERVELSNGKFKLEEAEVWPPADWRPPFTKEQLDAMVAIADPQDYAYQVDPLNCGTTQESQNG